MPRSEVMAMNLDEFFTYVENYNEVRKEELTLARNVHLNALANINRKKNSKFIELFQKEKKEQAKYLTEEELKEYDFLESEVPECHEV